MTAEFAMASNILMVLNDYLGTPGLLGQVITLRGGYYESYQPHQPYALTPGTGSTLPTDHRPYHGLVVLGGAMDAWNDDDYPAFSQILQLMREFHGAGKPVLGICLGAQLLARAFGSRVYRHHHPEIGFHTLEIRDAALEDPLLHGLGAELRLMQWHYDTFDLPEQATLLMSSGQCLHQGFKIGRSYGFQCHFEVTLDMIRDWVRSSHRRLSEAHPTVLDSLEADCRLWLPSAQRFGTLVMERWLDLIHNGANPR